VELAPSVLESDSGYMGKPFWKMLLAGIEESSMYLVNDLNRPNPTPLDLPAGMDDSFVKALNDLPHQK
jgi:hypothetical protein